MRAILMTHLEKPVCAQKQPDSLLQIWTWFESDYAQA